MPYLIKLSAGLVTSLLLCSALFTVNATLTADAKEYNKSKGVPSDSQALVNRIQAEMSTTNGEGEFGSMESNCDELDVGANTEATRPDDQVIIADKIINVGGHCRMIRNQGGFKPKADQPKSTDRVIGKPPAKH
jgi:hypothetical protein